MDIIRRIYKADMRHVERGAVVSVIMGEVLITSLGQPLANAIESGRITDRAAILAGVRSALDQMHAMGIAHCDVALCNVFLLPDGEVLLGDLEYCRSTTSIAPKDMHDSQQALSAQEMDEIQFKYFESEVDKKLEEEKMKAERLVQIKTLILD
jgi:serine/threonine protein kinase